MGDPVSTTIIREGLAVRTLDWGGTGPPLVLLHPNGFGAGLFDPLADLLVDTQRVLGVDLRGHGGSGTPADPVGYDMALMADDVAAACDAAGVSGAAVLGESLGGGVAVHLAARRPRLVSALILCEAIAVALPAPGAGSGPNTNAVVARKRRAVWPTRDAARHAWGSKPPLDALAPEALDAYVRFGLVERADGQVELACRPDAEADIFATTGEGGARQAFGLLPTLRCPVAVLAGTRSSLPLAWFEAQAAAAGVALQAVDGGHFFLQEDTARAGRLVRSAIADLMG